MRSFFIHLTIFIALFNDSYGQDKVPAEPKVTQSFHFSPEKIKQLKLEYEAFYQIYLKANKDNPVSRDSEKIF